MLLRGFPLLLLTISFATLGCSDGGGGGGGDGEGDDGGDSDVDGDGTGGGDTSGGTGGDSGGGTGGNDNCVPKTCSEIALELGGDADVAPGEEGSACGIFDDSCGGMVVCDPCDSEGHECGGERNTTSDLTFDTTLDGIEGICGGGCRAQDERYRNQFCGVDQALTGVSCALRSTPEFAGAQTDLTCSPVTGNSRAFCCE